MELGTPPRLKRLAQLGDDVVTSLRLYLRGIGCGGRFIAVKLARADCDMDCLPAYLANRHDSLTRCALLELLGLVCTIYPGGALEYSLFLPVEMLAEPLTSGPRASFLPFEMLELELVQHKERMVEGCAEACAKLASVLEEEQGQ